MRSLLQSIYRRLNRRLAIRKNVEFRPDLRVGAGTLIMAPDRLTIGDKVIIGANCWIACNGSIGDGVLMSSHVGIVGKHDHDPSAKGVLISEAPWIYEAAANDRDARHSITIESDVWIGFGAKLMSGIVVGRGSIVGAGAVVTRDVEPYSIVAGNPARKIRRRFTVAEAALHEAMLANPAPKN